MQFANSAGNAFLHGGTLVELDVKSAQPLRYGVGIEHILELTSAALPVFGTGGKSFRFNGLSGGEFAIQVGFRTEPAGMQQAALAERDTAGGTGDGAKLCRRQVAHSHRDSLRRE
jgi:hypothetical protein